MPVDLFGQPADYRALAPIASREGLKVLCDTAQGFGGLLDGKRAGAIGDAAATSFFPAKPLGCYGDGGACFTNDDSLKEALLSLRMHGQGSDRYEHVRVGYNSRLDTIQAAILIEKLKIFEDEIRLRNRVAKRYTDAFASSNRLVVPKMIDGATSTWAQYTLQIKDRAKFQADLKDASIPTAVYYPIPLSRQKAYADYPSVAHAGQRGIVQESGQPAHASLSGSGNARPHYWGGSFQRWLKSGIRPDIAPPWTCPYSTSNCRRTASLCAPPRRGTARE